MKTLDDFKNEVAQEHAGKNWGEITWTKYSIVDRLSDIASKRYAAYVCQEQRKLCAEHAGIKILWAVELMKKFPELNANINRIISSDSILNAPLATDKNK